MSIRSKGFELLSRIPIRAILLFIFIAIIFIISDDLARSERTVDAYTEWSGMTLTLNESVRVVSGGTLRIVASTVVFNCTYPLQYGITVEPGGALSVADSDGLASTRWDASEVSGTLPCFIVAEEGSLIAIQNSVISRCGQSGFPMAGGVEIHASDWRIEGSVFKDSYCGIGLMACSNGTIIGCNFTGLEIGVLGIQSAGIAFEESEFIALGTGVSLFYCSNVSLSGCNFTAAKSSGVQTESCTGVLVKRCAIKSCPAYGIYLEGSLGSASIQTPGAEILDCIFDGADTSIVLDNMRNTAIRNCSFVWFSYALSLWKLFATSITFEWNSLSFGGTGVECAVSSCRNLKVSNNTFSDLATAIVPGGDNAWIEDNRISNMMAVGISHPNTGTVKVSRNSFTNCTYGIRIERDLRFDPGMILSGNQFVDVKYGLLARDVRSLSLAGNTWTRGRTALTLLNLDASGISGETIADYEQGLFVAGGLGTVVGIDVLRCRLGVGADFGTVMAFVDCNLSGCILDATAINGTRLTMRDMLEADAFDVLDGTSQIRVEWTVTVIVRYASTDVPAYGIPITLVPSGHAPIGDFVTGTDGRVGPIVVPIADITEDGPDDYFPYAAVLTYNHGPHTLPVVFNGSHLFILFIDDIPPTAELLEPADGVLVNSSDVRCIVRATDDGGTVAGATLSVDGLLPKDVTDNAGGRPFTIALTDGTHHLVLRAFDTWSNVREAEVHVMVDTQSPVIDIDEPGDGTITNKMSIRVSGTIAGHSTAYIGDQVLPTDGVGRFELIVMLPDEGPNGIAVRAVDVAGNIRTERVEVVRDTVPPVIDVEAPPRLTNARTLTVRGVTDGAVIRCLGTNETREGPGKFELEVPLMEGVNVIRIEAEDPAGNVASYNLSCVSDQHLEFTILGPANGASLESARVVVNATGELGLTVNLTGPGTSFSINSTQDANMSWAIGPMRPGMNQFVFRVTDRAGNNDTIVYVLNVVEPPRRIADDRPGWFPLLLVATLALFICLAMSMWWRRRGR